MLADEAAWLRSRIEALDLRPGAIAVDVGSSTERFRTVDQPYITAQVFAPLLKRGVEIVHVDAKPDDGVDVVADMTAREPLPDRLVGCADLTLCTSLLEHVTDRASVIQKLHAITKPRGRLIVTVPHRYPIHTDPIDTLFRPSPQELADELSSLFSVQQTSLIDAAPIPLEIPNGPTWSVARQATRLVWSKLRGERPMPKRVLISGVIATRAHG